MRCVTPARDGAADCVLFGSHRLPTPPTHRGHVSHPSLILGNSSVGARLSGVNASLTLDAGVLTSGGFSVELKRDCSQDDDDANSKVIVGVSFSESWRFVGHDSDASISPLGGTDGWLNFTAGCTWERHAAHPVHIRGAFQYVTLFLSSASSGSSPAVQMRRPEVHYVASPDVPDDELQDYSGWFYSSDDLLNRIFYAGVHTLQLVRVGGHSGRVAPLPYVPTEQYGWNYSGVYTPLGGADVLLVDAPKRDRNPSQGDYSVMGVAAFYGHNPDGMAALRNALTTIVVGQNESTGLYPTAGPTLNIPPISDTYHLWVMSDIYDYWQYSGDWAFVQEWWAGYRRAMAVAIDKIDKHGLFNATLDFDWGRTGNTGHNAEANMIMYKVLRNSADIASEMGSEEDAEAWRGMAVHLRANITAKLWDEDKGAYRDNDTAAGALIWPEDGNSLAIRYGVERSAERQRRISSYLAGNLNEYGAVNPEGQGLICPFVASHELEAHFVAGQSAHGYNLLRTMWGYMLHAFSNSSLVEGYDESGALYYKFYGNKDAYISHSHGWGTGPVSTLLQHAVGLDNLTLAQGREWHFAPAVRGSGLEFARGGTTVPGTGEFSAGWASSRNGTVWHGSVKTPSGTRGTLSLELPEGADGEASRVDAFVGEDAVFVKGKPRSDVGGNGLAVHFDETRKRIVVTGVKGGGEVEVSVAVV